jgi:hypothetical protein
VIMAGPPPAGLAVDIYIAIPVHSWLLLNTEVEKK